MGGQGSLLPYELVFTVGTGGKSECERLKMRANQKCVYIRSPATAIILHHVNLSTETPSPLWERTPYTEYFSTGGMRRNLCGPLFFTAIVTLDTSASAT